MAQDRKDITLTLVKMVCTRSCPDRTYDCHGKCERYAEYRAKCDNHLHQKVLEREVNDAEFNAVKRTHGKRVI